MGTSDERVANKLARESLLRAVTAFGDDKSIDEIETFVDILDEHFAPGDLASEARLEPGVSPADAVTSVIIHQLRPLFDPIHDGRSAVDTLGFPVELGDLARRIVEELAFLVTFEARDAQVLHALRNEIVQTKDEGGSGTPNIAIRYLVCRAFDLICELTEHDFSSVPSEGIHWVDNDVSAFWRRLVARQGNRYRNGEFHTEAFDLTSTYLRAHPDAKPPAPTDGLPFYRLVRRAGASDIPTLEREDPITALLLADGVAIGDAAIATVHLEECGEPPLPVSESMHTRPVWAVVAEIRADCDSEFRHLVGTSPGSGAIRPFGGAGAQEAVRELPAARIRRDESILLPMATLVPTLPMAPAPGHELWHDWDRTDERSQTYVYGARTNQSFDLWGPAFLPSHVVFAVQGSAFSRPVRSFDIANAYHLDRSWMVGCCPHLFAVTAAGDLQYLGSPFANGPNIRRTFRADLQADIRQLVVAELEDEVTMIESLALNGEVVARDVVLRRSDTHVVNITQHPSSVEIKGTYALLTEDLTRGVAARNAAIRDYLASRI